jgi:hypothetical protein
LIGGDLFYQVVPSPWASDGGDSPTAPISGFLADSRLLSGTDKTLLATSSPMRIPVITTVKPAMAKTAILV